MSIFGSMKTAVSGMNAQANRLSTVADNISNSNTTGYKSASTAFSSLVMPSTEGNYNSGGVDTTVRYTVSTQGDMSYTTSDTDLAISGNGFFIVQGADGNPYLTRAGDFSKDASGNLVNSAGYTLMGYPYTSDTPSVVVNSFSGLAPINISDYSISAEKTSKTSFAGNLDSSSTAITSGSTAADNVAGSAYTSKTSIATYDSLGNTTLYDVYYTKTADNTWQVAAYNQKDASTTGSTSFPYASGPVGSSTLAFDANGKVASGGSLTLSDGTGITMDFSSMTQLGSAFTSTGSADGNAPSAVKGVKISKDGIVSATYADGTSKAVYRIPLATVTSPDNLTLTSGNVYSQSATSGSILTGFPGQGSFGQIQSGALEESNVDLAGQLTEMIEAQRSYTANSKVFQTGSDLMDVLVNLSR